MSARTFLRASVFVALASGLTSVAVAQAPAAPSSPAQTRNPNTPSTQNTVPEKIDSTGSTQNLSEKLNRSEGVITPPGNVDPGIAARAPVPNPGTTPVITPPGEPGGSQSVQPK